MRPGLRGFLGQWNARAAIRTAYSRELADQQAHTLLMERPNLYTEHDIGTKNVRYPNGRLQSVRTRKVRDTAGTPFYAFADSTPLS